MPQAAVRANEHFGHDHDHHHHHGGLKHYHDEEMQSVSIAIDGDVDPEKFMPWINDLVQVEGPNILRSKGILAFKKEPKRFVFQGVHMLLDGDVRVAGQAAAGPAQLVVLSQPGDALEIEARTDVKALLLSGQPLNEPIVGHGPFVMNTPQEIRQAIVDFNSGKFGSMGV